ncbi:hypothetical protein H5410_023115 [Solanum commersonii]|uniref:Uncharacterized protein n=1 Tax=Solanum commersonii TaxID=4109 RepID=A0A9J5ZGM9_SOLCO|nr:hypothetical protein H5410_023115 [Solanum commersonii]
MVNYSTRKSAKKGVYLLRGLFDLYNGSQWTIAHNNRQNGEFTCTGACLTLKIGRFDREGELAP